MANQSGTSRTSTRIDAFSVLGRFVVRAPWLIIAAWIVLVGLLAIAFPPLTEVVESQTVQPLPPKAMAAAEQMAKDFGESAQNVLIVVLTDGHTPWPNSVPAGIRVVVGLMDPNGTVPDWATTVAIEPPAHAAGW